MRAETIVQIAIPAVLGVIMLTMGLGLTPADFRRVIERPLAVGMGALCQLIVLPLVGWALAVAFGMPPELAVGMILVTCCPGCPSSNLMSHLARGDTALSVTLTAVSGVVTIFTIPLLVRWATQSFMGAEAPELPILKTNLQLIVTVALPVALGMLWRHRAAASADRWEPRLKRLSVFLLVVLIIGAVAKEHARVLSFAAQAGLPVITLTVVSMTLGFILARLARLDAPQSVTITLEVGMQNAAMAISIAIGLLKSTTIAIPGVIYGLWMYIPCAVVMFAARRWIADPNPRPHGHPLPL